MNLGRLFLVSFVIFCPRRSWVEPPSEETAGVRSTLANGMRVVIVRDVMAPVVTMQMNVMVGADESPPGLPGLAHAQEHMAFRGCAGLTADQTAAIYAQLGDDSNAETEQNVTEYYATVPASNLDVALQLQALCLRGIQNGETEWKQERGALEQEVASDLSDPTEIFLKHVNARMFVGTPYASDALGTEAAFESTSAATLQHFFNQWYTPSNALLVIVGDVHPSQTLNSVRRMFGSIPSHAVPVRPAVQLRSFSPETINIDNSLGYGLCFIAYRLPGTDSPEYAATQILVDVLASQRGKVAEMVSAGLLGDAQFELVESYPKASIGLASMSLPAEASPADAVAAVRLVLSNYALAGVPADLVDAAKRHEAAAANFQRTSIPDLARAWSHALGGEGRMSLSADIDALQQVTTADVDRIASKYLLNANSMTAIARPVASSIAPATERFHKGEKTASVPAKSVRLPDWANRGLDHFERPDTFVSVSDSFLANGLRLIVRTDRSSPTVLLLGSVKHGPNSRDMAGREGLSDLLEALYPYGTETMDRLTFQKSLGDITAEESAGYTFSLSVPKEHFSRGVELLADNELHPALTKHSFGVTKRETTEFVAGRARSPSYLTGRALKRALLPAGDPLLREVTPVTLSRLTLDQVRQYHSATIRPDLTTIVIIGDLSQGDAKAVVERWFGAWQGVGPRPDPSLPSVPQNKPSARDILDVDGTQDFVVLTQQLELNRLDRDYYPLKLGTSVLGGGFYATRLYNDLRKETGYVYSVDVSLNASTTRASYSVSYACNPRNVAKTRSIIERDVNQMRAESISEGELHQAKALLTRQAVLGESSEESLAQGLLDRAELGLPLDEPILAAKRYAELDAEDVRKAFAKTIHTSRFAQIVQGPAHN